MLGFKPLELLPSNFSPDNFFVKDSNVKKKIHPAKEGNYRPADMQANAKKLLTMFILFLTDRPQ
jgi:hypothetical protein